MTRFWILYFYTQSERTSRRDTMVENIVNHVAFRKIGIVKRDANYFRG